MNRIRFNIGSRGLSLRRERSRQPVELQKEMRGRKSAGESN